MRSGACSGEKCENTKIKHQEKPTILDDFPWRLEIQIRFQKGARMFLRLEEIRFSEIHQTIRSVNLRWFRQINRRAEARPDQIWDEVTICGWILSLKTIYNWKWGPTPPSRLQVCKGSCKPRTQYIFSGVHTATRHHESEELSVFTAVFKCYRKSSINYSEHRDLIVNIKSHYSYSSNFFVRSCHSVLLKFTKMAKFV